MTQTNGKENPKCIYYVAYRLEVYEPEAGFNNKHFISRFPKVSFRLGRLGHALAAASLAVDNESTDIGDNMDGVNLDHFADCRHSFRASR